MKKIILIILISTISLSSLAGVFNAAIPQPDFISNDWDNDGITNKDDTDDDNDGVDDIDDSTPFGQGGRSSTPDVIVNSFSSNKTSYLPGEEITLSWNIDNIRSLSLYNDTLNSDLGDMTNETSFNVSPIGDTTYQLDSETLQSYLSVYEYAEDSKDCDAWTPDASTIAKGEIFTQTRNCDINYSSSEPSIISLNKTESVENEGELIVLECRNRDATHYVAYITKNRYSNAIELKWGDELNFPKRHDNRYSLSNHPHSEETGHGAGGYKYWGEDGFNSIRTNSYNYKYHYYATICRKKI